MTPPRLLLRLIAAHLLLTLVSALSVAVPAAGPSTALARRTTDPTGTGAAAGGAGATKSPGAGNKPNANAMTIPAAPGFPIGVVSALLAWYCRSRFAPAAEAAGACVGHGLG